MGCAASSIPPQQLCLKDSDDQPAVIPPPPTAAAPHHPPAEDDVGNLPTEAMRSAPHSSASISDRKVSCHSSNATAAAHRVAPSSRRVSRSVSRSRRGGCLNASAYRSIPGIGTAMAAVGSPTAVVQSTEMRCCGTSGLKGSRVHHAPPNVHPIQGVCGAPAEKLIPRRPSGIVVSHRPPSLHHTLRPGAAGSPSAVSSSTAVTPTSVASFVDDALDLESRDGRQHTTGSFTARHLSTICSSIRDEDAIIGSTVTLGSRRVSRQAMGATASPLFAASHTLPPTHNSPTHRNPLARSESIIRDDFVPKPPPLPFKSESTCHHSARIFRWEPLTASSRHHSAGCARDAVDSEDEEGHVVMMESTSTATSTTLGQSWRSHDRTPRPSFLQQTAAVVVENRAASPAARKQQPLVTQNVVEHHEFPQSVNVPDLCFPVGGQPPCCVGGGAVLTSEALEQNAQEQAGEAERHGAGVADARSPSGCFSSPRGTAAATSASSFCSPRGAQLYVSSPRVGSSRWSSSSSLTPATAAA